MISFWISVVPPKIDGTAATIWARQTTLPSGPATASASTHRERDQLGKDESHKHFT